MIDRLTFLTIVSSTAKLLSMGSRSLRFQSRINKKIFSLAQDQDGFEFVELNKDVPDPDRTEMRDIYKGRDEFILRTIVTQELTQ